MCVSVAAAAPAVTSISGVIAGWMPLGAPQCVQNLPPWIGCPHSLQKFVVASSPTAPSSLKSRLTDAPLGPQGPYPSHRHQPSSSGVVAEARRRSTGARPGAFAGASTENAPKSDENPGFPGHREYRYGDSNPGFRRERAAS